MKQEHNPLTKEEYRAIKPGDVIERMLGFFTPVYLVVQAVTDDVIDAGWIFDRNTGLEIDEDIQATVSYISKVLTEEDKKALKEQQDEPKTP